MYKSQAKKSAQFKSIYSILINFVKLVKTILIFQFHQFSIAIITKGAFVNYKKLIVLFKLIEMASP